MRKPFCLPRDDEYVDDYLDEASTDSWSLVAEEEAMLSFSVSTQLRL